MAIARKCDSKKPRTAASSLPDAGSTEQAGRQSATVPAMASGPMGVEPGFLRSVAQDDASADNAPACRSVVQPGSSLSRNHEVVAAGGGAGVAQADRRQQRAAGSARRRAIN